MSDSLYSEVDLLGTEVRKNLLLTHPLLTSSEVVMTKPIEEIYLVIKRAVHFRESGVYFTAHSGVGKTKAISLVVDMLRMQIPMLTIFQHDAHNQQMASVRGFFKHFLNTVRHTEFKGETYDLRQRLTNRLVDDGRQSGLNLVVLIIDEAQAMSIQDFLFLKDVDNDLTKEGVNLVTITMGQEPDFGVVLQQLRDKRRLDLIARFAMRHVPLRAYSGIEDLAIILEGIDTAIFPEDSGWTWTRFFFPKAYRNGFRLANEAVNFLAALKHCIQPREDSCAFPARQCFLAIRALLVDNSAFDAADMTLPPDAWVRAVEYALLKDAVILINTKSAGSAIKVRA